MYNVQLCLFRTGCQTLSAHHLPVKLTAAEWSKRHNSSMKENVSWENVVWFLSGGCIIWRSMSIWVVFFNSFDNTLNVFWMYQFNCVFDEDEGFYLPTPVKNKKAATSIKNTRRNQILHSHLVHWGQDQAGPSDKQKASARLHRWRVNLIEVCP